MNVCVPVLEDKGLQSPISPHFGSAPLFMVVDAATGSTRAIQNRNLHHQHGMCQPLLALEGEDIGALVVGGIGMGALSRLQASGLRVFIADGGTVEEVLQAMKAGTLPEATPAMACSHHGQGPHGPGPHGPGPHGCGGPRGNAGS